MSRSGRTLATTMSVVALSSWSCGSTAPDVTPAVGAIVVSPASSTIALNAQLPLQAQVRDSSGAIVPDAPITWTVQDPRIVSVSNAGLVKALAVGTSQVAANALGESGIATITVTKVPVSNVALAPDHADLQVGDAVQLTASARDANGTAMGDRAIAWATSNAGVATVNGSGLVTAVGAGTATITATSEGKTNTSTVTVSSPAVARVDITPGSLSLHAGQTQQLAASAKDARGGAISGKTIVWSSDNSAVASVNGGLVTTSRSGVATISASVGSVKGTAAITVNPGDASSVTVSAPSKKLKVGSTMQLAATAVDARGNTVPNQSFYWSSSNTSAATVSSSGVVTGRRSGKATITAQTSASGGKGDSVQIDVK